MDAINGVQRNSKIFLVSRCAWTLYNFRSGLMNELVQRDVRVIGGGAGDDGFVKPIEDLGVPFKILPVDKKGINPLADLKLLMSLYRWYRNEKPDIVHHFTIKPVIYGSLAARFAGVPRIINTITGLGYVFTDKEVHLLRRFVEILYRLSLGVSHTVFFLNREDLEFFSSRILPHSEKAVLLPGEGVNCHYFSSEHYEQISNDGKPITFLMVSRLLKDKGVYEFVESAKIVKNRYPETEFHVLGKRDTRNPNVVSATQIRKWQERKFITWHGEATDVRPFIERSHVIVLPSYREGLPKSLLEGSAMEKAIIATDTIGCRDVVDNGVTGILVPVKDSTALADAMIQLIEDPVKRRRMGRAGRRKVEREFDEQIVIRQTLAAYGEDECDPTRHEQMVTPPESCNKADR